MRRYNITNKAVEYLNSIWIYTFETWSEQQADKYYKELIREFSIIVSSTKTNDKNYEEICHGLRGHKCNKHIIFYKRGDDGIITIIRILHEAMDVSNKF